MNYGIEGAAIGTITANIIGVFASALYLISDNQIRGQLFIKSKVQLEHVFNFGRNSLNIFGRSFFLTTAFYISTKMSALLGIESLAAHQNFTTNMAFFKFLPRWNCHQW